MQVRLKSICCSATLWRTRRRQGGEPGVGLEVRGLQNHCVTIKAFSSLDGDIMVLTLERRKSILVSLAHTGVVRCPPQFSPVNLSTFSPFLRNLLFMIFLRFVSPETPAHLSVSRASHTEDSLTEKFLRKKRMKKTE